MTATTTQANGTTSTSTAIEKKPPTRMAVLKGHFDEWRPTLAAVLPKHIEPDRVIKIAMSVYMNKPELATCTPISMVKATVQCAELGLDPTPLLGEAYFLPFKNTKKKQIKDGNVFKDVTFTVEEVQLMPGYPGLIKLAKQTGEVSDVYAVVVYESERKPVWDDRGRLVAGFCVEEGTDRKIHHVRSFEGERGGLFAVYGVVKFKDGTNHFEVLSKSDVDAVRARSKAAQSGPWVTDYDEMAKKTAIKRALKTVPKSPEKMGLVKAIAADTAVDLGEAFRGDLAADAIDTTGESAPDSSSAPVASGEAAAETPTTDAPKGRAPSAGSRTAALSSKLSEPKEKPPTPAKVEHDPATGEVMDPPFGDDAQGRRQS